MLMRSLGSCMLVTNYSGNVSSVVDDHFTRALNVTTSDKGEQARGAGLCAGSLSDVM